MLATKNIRVVKYDELLADARAGYREYINKQDEMGRIRKLLDSLADEADVDAGRVEAGSA
jgi:hypothetical protein